MPLIYNILIVGKQTILHEKSGEEKRATVSAKEMAWLDMITSIQFELGPYGIKPQFSFVDELKKEDIKPTEGFIVPYYEDSIPTKKRGVGDMFQYIILDASTPHPKGTESLSNAIIHSMAFPRGWQQVRKSRKQNWTYVNTALVHTKILPSEEIIKAASESMALDAWKKQNENGLTTNE